jgi:prevent-host-death family protein
MVGAIHQTDKMKVDLRELKNKLSEYLNRVKAGQIIVITERGKPIGQILPINKYMDERSGDIEWDGKKLKHYKPLAVNRGDRQVSDLVVEDRQ